MRRATPSTESQAHLLNQVDTCLTQAWHVCDQPKVGFAAIAAVHGRTVTSRSACSSGHRRDGEPRRPFGRFQMYSRRPEHAAVKLHLERPMPPIANWRSWPATVLRDIAAYVRKLLAKPTLTRSMYEMVYRPISRGKRRTNTLRTMARSWMVSLLSPVGKVSGTAASSGRFLLASASCADSPAYQRRWPSNRR